MIEIGTMELKKITHPMCENCDMFFADGSPLLSSGLIKDRVECKRAGLCQALYERAAESLKGANKK